MNDTFFTYYDLSYLNLATITLAGVNGGILPTPAIMVPDTSV
jgi:hypothetical protein